MINAFSTNLNLQFSSYAETGANNMRIHQETVDSLRRTIRSMEESQIRETLKNINNITVLHDLAQRLGETGHPVQAKVVWSMWDESH